MSRTLSALESLGSPLFWIGVLVRVSLVVPAVLRLCSLRALRSSRRTAQSRTVETEATATCAFLRCFAGVLRTTRTLAASPFGTVCRWFGALVSKEIKRKKSGGASSDSDGVLALPVRAAATVVGLVAYTQALWRHLDGCRLSPAMTRPTQAFLLTMGYTARALWEQRGRGDDW
ncbi:hypothetical protein HPB50_014485 [Hyalomma asiaticum]|uniref:Uncharacterized protein n=1 Tax=Hyalomma asiaticum TaxID=266040 RepID=A0ACB7SEJ4_HYAAI|nr:hypothetical protein HPB50_014485 [Hyalomma asiaticum]